MAKVDDVQPMTGIVTDGVKQNNPRIIHMGSIDYEAVEECCEELDDPMMQRIKYVEGDVFDLQQENKSLRRRIKNMQVDIRKKNRQTWSMMLVICFWLLVTCIGTWMTW